MRVAGAVAITCQFLVPSLDALRPAHWAILCLSHFLRHGTASHVPDEFSVRRN